MAINAAVPITAALMYGDYRRRSVVFCGPRDNRGKLQRGRTLSTESILAIQSLKRAANRPQIDAVVTAQFSRLLKSDLLAALSELLRQNRWQLALKALDFARREPWYKAPDFALFAEVIAALGRCGVGAEIDAVVEDLVEEMRENGGIGDAGRVCRVLRALLTAERGDLAMVVYREMRRGGCEGEEVLFKLLGSGLRRLGLVEMAEEVWRDFKVWDEGGFVSVEEEHVGV